MDERGNVYTGLEDGRIIQFAPSGGAPDVVAVTGGRPLGVELDCEGRLVVCDAYRGLLRLEAKGPLTVLASAYEDEAFLLTNNAAVGSDGTIYFSVSSRRYNVSRSMHDLLEHSGTGRLYSYRSDTSLHLLLDNLQFANGVALSSDESFVAVAETGAYRIRRLWLRGERTGQVDYLITGLPGFPDNLTSAEGVFWVGFPSLRQRPLDLMAPRPRMRRLLARLPERFLPKPTRHGLVLGIDERGSVVHNLQDPGGAYSPVMTAYRHGEHLYLGSESEWAVGRVRLQPA